MSQKQHEGNPSPDRGNDGGELDEILLQASQLYKKQNMMRDLVPETEHISEDEEEILWRKGLLGGDTPDSLHNTTVWICKLFLPFMGVKS